jgi:penicillin-binding protein 1A
MTSKSGKGARLKRALTGAGEGVQSLGRSYGQLGLRKGIAVALLAILLVGVGVLALRIATLPDFEELEARADNRLLFTDATGDPLLIGGVRPSDHATIDRIPEYLKQAVIATEDARFRDHGGLDFRAIGRAFIANAQAGGIVQGGSTITQQLVKVRYLEREKTYARKLHEALLARQMEAAWTKDQILEEYLNTIYLGNGAHGVVSAARVHFNRPVEDLTLAESAAIAAMIQAPSVVNPTADPDALRARAGHVIGRMEAEGMIEPGAANAARVAVASLQPRRTEMAYGGWFADWIATRAGSVSGQFKGDSTVRTTLDPALQVRAEQAVAQVLDGTSMEAAVVVLRADGTLAAMVGGRDYATSQFNRAVQALRQPGSTFKTFTYLAALEAGLGPDDVISDAAIDIDGYVPDNFDGRYHGNVTLREAFAHSYNAAAVRLAQDLGVERVAEAARVMGIEAELSETPSLALGASGTSLLDLTEAYAALATGRPGLEARGLAGISTGEDATFYPFEWTDPAPSAYATRLMAQREPMVELLRAVVTEGTGKAVSAVPGAVGKTGTSQNFRDALFVGWAGDMIAGVWVGNDDNSPMDEVTGGGAPAQIWADVMTASATLPADTQIARDEQTSAEAALPETALPQADTSPQTTSLPQIDEGEATGVRTVTTPRRMGAAELETLLEAAREGDVDALVRTIRSAPRQGQATVCNVRRCERSYRSFRASDCTFQPYGGGPREICTR